VLLSGRRSDSVPQHGLQTVNDPGSPYLATKMIPFGELLDSLDRYSKDARRGGWVENATDHEVSHCGDGRSHRRRFTVTAVISRAQARPVILKNYGEGCPAAHTRPALTIMRDETPNGHRLHRMLQERRLRRRDRCRSRHKRRITRSWALRFLVGLPWPHFRQLRRRPRSAAVPGTTMPSGRPGAIASLLKLGPN
jgi:hypothetical protein